MEKKKKKKRQGKKIKQEKAHIQLIFTYKRKGRFEDT